MTNDIKHTPGPWSHADRAKLYIQSVGEVPSRICVIDCFSSEDEDKAQALANARLIAAAPELLEALEIARDFILTIHGRENLPDSSEKDTIRVIEKTIAKARGGA